MTRTNVQATLNTLTQKIVRLSVSLHMLTLKPLTTKKEAWLKADSGLIRCASMTTHKVQLATKIS